ncbi:MAG TPA: hypothetical protein VMX55_06965 [candidate division Zixibacteria bacterium]|nr:hypothetical protein [candidate division Zixibacteria bacterium]
MTSINFKLKNIKYLTFIFLFLILSINFLTSVSQGMVGNEDKETQLLSPNDDFNLISLQGNMPIFIHKDTVFLYSHWDACVLTVDISDIDNPGEPNSIITNSSYYVRGFNIYEDYLITDAGANLLVYDISNPNTIGDPIHIINEEETYGFDIGEMCFENNIAYISSYNIPLYEIYIVDFTDFPDIVSINNVEVDYLIDELYFEDGYLYFSTDEFNYSGFIDLTDPQNPGEPIYIFNATVDFTMDIMKYDDFLYVSTNNNEYPQSGYLSVIDISDKNNPSEIKTIETVSSTTFHMTIYEETLYIGLDDFGVIIFDISDPSNPIEAGRTSFNTGNLDVYDLAVFNDYLFMSAASGLGIISLNKIGFYTRTASLSPLVIILGLLITTIYSSTRKRK